MKLILWTACGLVAAYMLVASGATTAQDKKSTVEGKGATFKSKTFEIKEKGSVSIALSFAEGKEVTVTTKGAKETDVYLFLKSMYFDYKDTSPGPECLMKFTPVKGDETFTFTIRNQGPGANKVTLEVKVAE